MEIFELSRLIFDSCDRIHQIVDDLYEAVHDEFGGPVETSDEVERALGEVKTLIWHEIDLIRSAVDEHES